MRKNRFPVNVLLMFLLTSCSLFSASNLQPTTAQVQTIGNAITPTNSGHGLGEIDKNCVAPQPTSEALDILISGVLYISDSSSDFLLGWKSQRTYSLAPEESPKPGIQRVNSIVSPNRKWLAYQVDYLNQDGVSKGISINVANAHGKTQAELAWDEHWLLLRAWLDDEHLLIEAGEMKPKGTIFIIEPFTGKSQELSLSYSDFYADYPPASWVPFYDNSLSRVLYANGPSAVQRTGYTMRDVLTGEKLWQRSSRTAPALPPQWSFDGSRFALVVATDEFDTKDEIFIIDSRGHPVLQTELSSNYPTVFIGPEFRWSPDGKQLAFWVSTDTQARPSFSILNIETDKITDYCILSYGTGDRPVWSPDSQKVIITADKLGGTVLLDVTRNEAELLPIKGEWTVLSWMVGS
jgi:hypothetical protein